MSSVRHRRVKQDQPEPAAETSLPLIQAAEGPQEQLATNTGVRLACTMAAMVSPFAVFLCWAERESRVIRRFAVQSAALLVVHAVTAVLLAAIGFFCSAVPYFGFLVKLVCWLVYIAAVIVLIALRIRLMESAWHGRRFDMPLLEKCIREYY